MAAYGVVFWRAAVAAGISTVLLLGTLARVGYQEREPSHRPILPLFVVLVTGGVLVYGTADIPPFGEALNPAHQHALVARHYLDRSYDASHIPNVVTTVLGSYRGYDTMGETAVVFTAMVGVLLLLARGPLPTRVYHKGRWLTISAGMTRKEFHDEREGHDRPDGGRDGEEDPPRKGASGAGGG